ncbi:hypothetical protein D3227_34455 [Mesorhizobium waimense]|uniref:Uncharacterized protein n=1 Tax=Mesorhizobium waimense TaxID=1300307 RepID=A0A3A5K7R4_9HYPH|nr:hypothetical protein [Mesorhizobium waimense]RJT28295.1 hypothetical protein D3227_34455 [Mesorhizobium waimense]
MGLSARRDEIVELCGSLISKRISEGVTVCSWSKRGDPGDRAGGVDLSKASVKQAGPDSADRGEIGR